MSLLYAPSRLFVLLSLVVLIPSVASAQVKTKRSVCFGDSLTDNEYVYLLFGTDPQIYGSDPFQAVFDRAAKPGDTLTNYAVLRSTSDQVLDQTIAYAQSRWMGNQPPSTLASLQSGGNDLLTTEVLLTLATAPPGESEAADEIVNQIRSNLFASLALLRFTDPRATVVVWTVPDVRFTPYVLWFQLDPQSQQNIGLHIQRLNESIRSLGSLRRIAILDISRVMTEVSLDPPTIDGITLVPPPNFGFGAAVFADPIHPTAVANGLLANEMITSLNEVCHDRIPLYSESELGQLIVGSP